MGIVPVAALADAVTGWPGGEADTCRNGARSQMAKQKSKQGRDHGFAGGGGENRGLSPIGSWGLYLLPHLAGAATGVARRGGGYLPKRGTFANGKTETKTGERARLCWRGWRKLWPDPYYGTASLIGRGTKKECHHRGYSSGRIGGKRQLKDVLHEHGSTSKSCFDPQPVFRYSPSHIALLVP